MLRNLWYLGGPMLLPAVIDKVVDMYGSEEEGLPDDKVPPASFGKELESIISLIEEGRRNGLSEINVELSESLARDLSAEGGAAIKAIPVNAALKFNMSDSGKNILNVKFLPVGVAEKIKEFHVLFESEVITEEEFLKAKQKIIENM